MMNTEIRFKIIDVLGIIGGLTLTYFAVGYLMEKLPLRLTPVTPLPQGGSLPAQLGPGDAPPAAPRLMTESPLAIVPGRRYGVSLDTPGIVPFSTARSKAETLAKEMGFTNIHVYSDPPPGWPGKQKSVADTYVVGFYEGKPQQLPRSKSGVDVIEAFEG